MITIARHCAPFSISPRLLSISCGLMLSILGNLLQIMSVDIRMGGADGGLMLLGALALLFAWAAFALPTLRYWEFI